MKSSLWKAPWGNRSTVTKHNSHRISISPLTGDKVWRQITRTDTMTHCLAHITGHLLQKYESKKEYSLQQELYLHDSLQSRGSMSLYITVCEMGMPTPATQSTDTFKETKYKIKIDSALCWEQTPLVPLHNGYCIPGSRACDILFHPPIPPTFLPPVRLRPKLLSLEATLPGLPGHGPFSWRVRGNRVASRSSAAALRDKLQLHLNCYTGQMMLSFS